ncbi:hypothetical protein BX616_000279 [Lobosporangium transversale]
MSSTRGAYKSLTQEQSQAHTSQSFPLHDRPHLSTTLEIDSSELYSHDDDEYKGFQVTISRQHHRDNVNDNDNDDDDDDDDEDVDEEHMNDVAPLANSKHFDFEKSRLQRPSRASHPCKILATVFGTAMVVSLAFALLSLLHLDDTTLDQKDSTDNNNNTTVPDNRILKPPPGISIDDFSLSQFHLPPWDWDINTFLPINITNGLKFTQIRWKDGKQYLAVDCPGQGDYRYRFPSFMKDEFRNHPTMSQGIDDLLPIGDEPYVFVLCPPGVNNANVVFREFDATDTNNNPDAPPPIAGTMETPQPLLDDVVMILVDAISRAKFTIEMKAVMETLTQINSTATSEDEGHRIFDFEHYNVLGQNSPPNKAFIYSGQSIENMRHGPKHWLWDVFEEQGFRTAHTDGECGGEQGIHDYTSGAISFEYSHLNRRIPAQYQMPQPVWCENHDMHVVSQIWGQSCKLPETVNYDTALMGGMRWNTPYCAGEKAIHEHIMENLEGWLTSTKGQRRFATYSFMDTHSPDHHHISFDKRLALFIKSLLVGHDGQPPLLTPKSALVIMADHGLHYGRETYTFPGFIHHKIPPLYIALPRQLLSSRPDFVQALEQNQNRILSHLDLHQTFLHLAYGDMPISASDGGYTSYMTKLIADGTFRQQFHPGAPNQTSYAQEYGRSLLLPIEEDRTCSSAGIPNDFCAFQPFLELDPRKEMDATFLRGSLLLLAKRMNELIQIHRVDDVCQTTSLVLQPLLVVPSVSSTFDDIGTQDLVMESAYASAITNRVSRQQQQQPQSNSRVFYFMVRDRHRPNRKYSITMREDEVVMEKGDSIRIQQMSAYAAEWRPCARRIVAGGRAVGKWQDIIKHFCVC